MVEESFGGGTYTIHPGGSPKVLKRYEVDGESKYLIGGPKQKTPKQQYKDDLLRAAWAWLETEASEDIREKVTQAIIEKELGIELPPRPTVEEKLIRKKLYAKRAVFEDVLGADELTDADPIRGLDVRGLL